MEVYENPAFAFARYAHRHQKRKYTFEPYYDSHLLEVVDILNQFGYNSYFIQQVAVLHDCIEDAEVPHDVLVSLFGKDVADAVLALSDVEEGNRQERHRASCERLRGASTVVKIVKCADILSNAQPDSIIKHDPKFAVIWLQEKYQQLVAIADGAPVLTFQTIWSQAMRTVIAGLGEADEVLLQRELEKNHIFNGIY